MKRFYKKFGRWIIILLLLGWTILTPYPFQKGGLNKTIYYFIIVAFVFFLAGLITLLFDNFNKAERLILTVIFSIVSLLVVTTLIMPFIENLFSGDYTRFFWGTKDRILINIIFYGLTFAFVTTFCSLYSAVKKRKTRKIISVHD
jgi:cytochrome c biogenesis protein CcdA